MEAYPYRSRTDYRKRLSKNRQIQKVVVQANDWMRLKSSCPFRA